MLASEIFTISKFIWEYKFLISKNRKNLIDADLLLLSENSIIDNFQLIILLIVNKATKMFFFFLIGNFALSIYFWIKCYR